MTRNDLIFPDDGLIFAEVDGEAAALNAVRGQCYGLDEAGLRVLQFIGPPATPADICARLTAEYDIDTQSCERDVGDLIDNLAAEGLVSVKRDVQIS